MSFIVLLFVCFYNIFFNNQFQKNISKNLKMFKKLSILPLITLSTLVFSNYTNAEEIKSNDPLQITNLTYDLKTSYNQQPTNTQVVSKFFSALPFEYSIKTRYGAGKNIVAMFIDANCPFCLQQEKILKEDQDVINTTAFVFLLDINNDDKSRINDYIWCSPVNERAKRLHSWYKYRLNKMDVSEGIAFGQWKIENQYPEIDLSQCNTPIKFNQALLSSFVADENGFINTPTILFSNGMSGKGVIETFNLVEAFKYVQKNPLTIEGYEKLNQNSTVEKVRFFKQEYLKQLNLKEKK